MAGYCSYCNRWTERLTRDHVIPRAKGGTDAPGNIVAACQSCNSRKGAKDVKRWVGVSNSVQELMFTGVAYD